MKNLALVFTFALLLTACGEGETMLSQYPSISLQCGEKVAQIAVMDGFLRDLCGCTEPNGTTTGPGQSLTCTVSAGTVVVFQYIGTKLTHQIVSTGTPTFISSAVSSPTDRSRFIASHGVKLDTAGTYTFQDSFMTSLSGSIVVTP